MSRYGTWSRVSVSINITPPTSLYKEASLLSAGHSHTYREQADLLLNALPTSAASRRPTTAASACCLVPPMCRLWHETWGCLQMQPEAWRKSGFSLPCVVLRFLWSNLQNRFACNLPGDLASPSPQEKSDQSDVGLCAETNREPFGMKGHFHAEPNVLGKNGSFHNILICLLTRRIASRLTYFFASVSSHAR